MESTSKAIKSKELPSLVGKETGTSEWFTITQDIVDQFAATTRDPQFLHTDPEKAKHTPFGGTIAHGFLTLSMLSFLGGFAERNFGLELKNLTMGLNYGFDTVRFLNPVRVGKRIRATAVLLAATEKKPGHFILKYQVTVEIEGESRPALVAEWLNMSVVQ